MSRRGRKPGKERKGYFYEKEEEAVVNFINSGSQEERDKIYKETLYTAFTKMVESIIRRYNLYIPDEEFQETFDDTMSFLTTKLSYYDPKRNYKAYSYCGTICKNYLIYKINQFSKRQSKNISYDDTTSDWKPDIITDSIKYSYNDDDDKFEYFKTVTSTTVEKIRRLINSGTTESGRQITETERKVGYALIELFKNWEEIFLIEDGSNKFTKSSIQLFIKEYTNLTPKEIGKAMRLYKGIYYNLKKLIISGNDSELEELY